MPGKPLHQYRMIKMSEFTEIVNTAKIVCNCKRLIKMVEIEIINVVMDSILL